MANKGTGFDPSGLEALCVSGKRKGAAFQITSCARFAQENGKIQGARDLGSLVVGLTGRDLILKYSRVPQVPDWQLAKLMDFEVDGIAGQSGGALSSDYNLLPVQSEMTGEDTVLLALAKLPALDAQMQRLSEVGGAALAFTPNPVAIYNCFLQLGPVTDDATCLIAWMGESSIDLALIRGASLLFARNVAGGLSILDGAIAQTFNVRDARARKIRRELLDIDPASKGKYASSQEEKVAHAVQGVSGQLQAALRSTLAFCQSQIQIQELSLDRVLLCGPGAKIRGMDRFLEKGLACPVEVWNPVSQCDLSTCDAESAAVIEDAGSESVVALGLALAPCFEDLYSIEILPEQVKKKRRFFERTIFNIAAIVLALGYLGYHFVTARSDHEAANRRARSVSAKANRIQKEHESAEKLLKSNEDASARIASLEELLVPLHGALRVFQIANASLPENLWLRKLESRNAAAPWLQPKGERVRRARQKFRNYLTFEGRGLPMGADRPQVTYQDFQTAIRNAVPYFQDSVSRGDPFTFKCTVDFLFEKKPEATDPEGKGR